MKGGKIILHAKLPTFRAAKLKSFTITEELPFAVKSQHVVALVILATAAAADPPTQ